MDRYFNLYSYCLPVKGKRRAVVCNLHRNVIQPVPLIVYDFLKKVEDERCLESFIIKFSRSEREVINEYINFLYHNEFGYFSSSPVLAYKPELPEFQKEGLVTNAIVDFNKNSTHKLERIVPQLSELGCKAIEVRYFDNINTETFERAVGVISDCGFDKIEFLLKKNDDFDLDYFVKINIEHPNLFKVTLSSASENVIYNKENLVVIYTTEVISNETKCGVTGELYCIAESKLFWESHHFNNCLYKKISVDKGGKIKNCPSMNEDFGSVETVDLRSVIELDSFKKYWKINKDSIEVCCECELRYVCQDCRAYTVYTDRINSKPLKCRYNPCN